MTNHPKVVKVYFGKKKIPKKLFPVIDIKGEQWLVFTDVININVKHMPKYIAHSLTDPMRKRYVTQDALKTIKPVDYFTSEEVY